MKCNLCGRVFNEKAAAKECARCAVFRGCRMVKCPYCGYESPRETGLVQWLKNRTAKKR